MDSCCLKFRNSMLEKRVGAEISYLPSFFVIRLALNFGMHTNFLLSSKHQLRIFAVVLFVRSVQTLGLGHQFHLVFHRNDYLGCF